MSRRQPPRRTQTARSRRAPNRPDPARLARMLLEQYAGIAGEEDPIQLEMVASDLAGAGVEQYWLERKRGCPHPTEAMLALLGHVRERTLASDALALATGLHALAVGDEAALRLGEEVRHKLRFLGGRPSPAFELLEQLAFTETWLHQDLWGEQRTIAVGAAYGPDAVNAHTLCVLVDAELMSIKDIFLGPPADEYVQALREQLDADPHAAGLSILERVEPAAAAAMLRHALELTEDTLGAAIEDEEAYLLLPIVMARVEQLRAAAREAAAAAAGLPDAPVLEFWSRPVLDELDEDTIYDGFIASDEFQEEAANGANEASVRVLVDHLLEQEGGPARFGPVAPERFLLDRISELVLDDGMRKQLATGAVATVRAWTRYSHRLLDLPTVAVDAVLESLAHIEQYVPQALDGTLHDDEDEDGQRGFASRLLDEMLARGMDPADPEQLDAFMREFNEQLTFEERGRILGLEG